MTASTPCISVVVTMIHGTEVLRRCLAALRDQSAAPPFEVLVTYDDRFPDAPSLAGEFPDTRFFPVEGIANTDVQRPVAILEARGDIVAITEDFCVPAPDWCARLAEILADGPVAAGGRMEMLAERPDLLSRTFHLYDYGLFAVPGTAGPTVRLTDSNVAYDREALDGVEDAWSRAFYVPEVNDRLRRRGGRLFYSPDLVVRQERAVTLGRMMDELYRNGRLYGRRRAAGARLPKRLFFAALTPLVPLVQIQRRLGAVLASCSGSLAALPVLGLMGLLTLGWTWGELLGTLTPAPAAARPAPLPLAPRDEGQPELSVVVASIAGGSEVIRECLAALALSAADHDVECIVPFDARLDDVERLRPEFPWVDFVDAGDRIDPSKLGEHSREHHDVLRAIGLARSRGQIVGLLEDHAPPPSDWCTRVLEAHRTGPAAAIGGAVECGVPRLLNRAVYYCDFGRYQNPVPEGPVDFLSDCNTAYRREALHALAPQWESAFHEAMINWKLRDRGELLRMDPGIVVEQKRTTLRLGPALRERFVWGRSFGGNRVRENPRAKRFIWAGLAFVLPTLLTWRVFSTALGKRRSTGQLVACLPLIALFQTIWALGEFVGYVTGRTGGPESASRASQFDD